MTQTKDWIDLSGYGFKIFVAEYSVPGGDKAILIRGNGDLSRDAETALRRQGFRLVPGETTTWARPGASFTLSDVRAAFPQARVTQMPTTRTQTRIEGKSPFNVSQPAPAAPAAISKVPAATPAPSRRGLALPGGRKGTSTPAPASSPAPRRTSAPVAPVSPASPQGFGKDTPPPPPRPAPRSPRGTPASVLSAVPDAAPDATPVEEEDVYAFEAVNAFQARYQPASKVGRPIAMVPLNMASASKAALERIARENGDIDAWVAGKLGWSIKEMEGYLSPEQVDAVALAVHAAERGRGFILADQTGLGKGRVLAAVARAAVLAKRRVVFLTEKANLFSDFWRDVADIGSAEVFGTPFLVNDKSRIIDASSVEGRVLHEAPKKADTQRVIKSGRLPKGCRLVMATYSQFNRKGTAKAEFLRKVSEGARFVSDECHNAVGDSNTSEVISAAAKGAESVTYSSATFARNAANMAAYAPIFPPSLRAMDMAEVLKAGGPPLQEALSQTLAEDGVLARREHDLSNIRIVVKDDTARLERNRGYADALAPILARLAHLARQVDAIAEQRNGQNQDHVESLPPGKDRKASREKWYTVNFGSRLSAIVRQFVTALKVDQCVEEAVASLLRGEKPVVVIESTMESLMRELSADDGPDGAETYGEDGFGADEGAQEAVAEGARPPDFRDALRLMLDRMMMLSVKRPDADPEKVEVDDPMAAAEAEVVREMIDGFPDLPLSPIDDVRERVESEGRRLAAEGVITSSWSAEEISARSTRVVDGAYVPMPKRDRNELIAQFNGGRIDFLVITKAGSTGLSLHASERVADQRKRLMIELQIPSNVVERVQFWGRVNRRGQVCEPDFLTLSTGLPLEVRLLAMQNRKVADLSANVTASSQSASAMDVPDIIDSAGNGVCKRLLEDAPSLAERMCIGMRVDAETAEEELYFVNKLLSRLVLIPSDEQEQVYATAVAAYEDAMRELDARGRHPHKARELEGTWRIVGREFFEAGNVADGPVFGRPVYVTTIESRQTLRPLSDADVRELVTRSRERLAERFGDAGDGSPFASLIKAVRSRREAILAAALAGRMQSVRQALSASKHNAVKAADQRLSALCDAASVLRPGVSLTAANDDGVSALAVVTDVRPPQEEDAHHPGKWIVRYVFPGDEQPREVSMATILRDSKAAIHAPRPGESLRDSYPQFDRIDRGDTTVTRKVLDGNLVAAVKTAREGGVGTAVSYMDDQRRRRRGVLIPRTRQNAIHTLPARTSAPEAAFEVVRRGGRVHTNRDKPSDGAIVRSEAGMAVIEIPGGKRAAKPFETSAVREVAGEFRGDWRFREARVPPEHLLDVLRALAEAGHEFHFDGRYRELVAAAPASEDSAQAPPSGPR